MVTFAIILIAGILTLLAGLAWRKKRFQEMETGMSTPAGDLESSSATIRAGDVNISITKSEEVKPKTVSFRDTFFFQNSTADGRLRTDTELDRVVVEQLKRQLPITCRIKLDQIDRMNEVLGEGEFGVVYKALYTAEGSNYSQVVAVKTLKVGLNGTDKLLTEGIRMKFFDHANVLKLIGVCLESGGAPYIIMPYMANGSLQQYLKREHRRLVLDRGDKVSSRALEVEEAQRQLTDMCLQIAQGMKYLAQKKFVHRNLATRNCMVGSNLAIKISDFGYAEDIDEETCFIQAPSTDVKLPIQWLAPESIMSRVYSEGSDVWSYGVTCWEVFSAGDEPPLEELDEEGKRRMLEAPHNAACPTHMYEVMAECWEHHEDERPTFSALVTEVSALLESLPGCKKAKVKDRGLDAEDLPAVSVGEESSEHKLLPKQQSLVSVTGGRCHDIKKKVLSLKRGLKRTRSKTIPEARVESLEEQESTEL